MYNFHFSNNEQPTLPPYYVNPYIMQQLLVSQWHWQANTMPSGWGFVDYGLPFYQWPIPVYYQHCQWQQALNSDPSRYNQSSIHSSRFHMTEPLPTYNIARESLGMIQEDRPTGIHPGHAWIGPNFNTGVGEMPIQPYHTYRYGPNRRKIRSDWVNPSTYEIRIAESRGGTITEDPAPSSISESSAQPPISKDTSTKNILAQEHDDDPDTISLGSKSND